MDLEKEKLRLLLMETQAILLRYQYNELLPKIQAEENRIAEQKPDDNKVIDFHDAEQRN